VQGADPLHRALHADLALYLPGDLLPLSDRVTMAHGLELRVPFLDHELLEFAARIPAEYKVRGAELKHVLRRAVADLVPPNLLRRPKMGFSAPTQVWFRGPLRDYVEDTLSHTAVAAGGVFRPAAVRELLDAHFARRENHDDRLFALLTFTVWQREYGMYPA
jgi:asparagine synthase (glutamine-hydrolysing)